MMRHRKSIHVGSWVIVVTWPGLDYSFDRLRQLGPRFVEGSIGVKRLVKNEMYGCWTPWNGKWYTFPVRIGRLIGKMERLSEWSEPRAV
jgi:hypothetical protein